MDTMDSRRRQIVEDAILQMRATGEALGPEFLARIKILVRDFDPAFLFPEQEFSSYEGGKDGVDRKKNLLIIMRFLQLKEQDKGIQRKVLSLLSENQTTQ